MQKLINNVCTSIIKNVPNDQKFEIFPGIGKLVIKTSPTIQKGKRRCVILWSCPKIKKKKIEPDMKTKKNKRTKQALFFSSWLGLYLLWMIIWKRKNICTLIAFQKITKLFQCKAYVMHTKTFLWTSWCTSCRRSLTKRHKYLILDKFPRRYLCFLAEQQSHKWWQK